MWVLSRTKTGLQNCALLRTARNGWIFRTRYKDQVVTIEDFLAVMQEVSPLDLSHFALWFHQSGTPVVTVTDQYDPETQCYQLTIKQVTAPTPDQPDKQSLFIPVQMGLLDANGNVLSFRLDGSDTQQAEAILFFDKALQAFTFHGVGAKPIPSLLRDFSAPVKLTYDYSNANLIVLIQYDPNFFNRLEAMQQFIQRHLLALIKDCQQNKSLAVSDEVILVFRHILQSHLDPWLRAAMLEIPQPHQISKYMDRVDIDAIVIVHKFFSKQIAVRLQTELSTQYHQCDTQDNFQATSFELLDIGIRSLKNRCLQLLIQNPSDDNMAITRHQFNTCLAVNRFGPPCREQRLEEQEANIMSAPSTN